ncbi:MAG: hypothetical protein NVSMB20_05300 [Bradyrhizobium sp.]
MATLSHYWPLTFDFRNSLRSCDMPSKPLFGALNADGSVTINDWQAAEEWRQHQTPGDETWAMLTLMCAARGHIPERSKEDAMAIAEQAARDRSAWGKR